MRSALSFCRCPSLAFFMHPFGAKKNRNDPQNVTPVLAKHTKSFNLVDTLSVGVDRIQRNFEPMQRQVESWRQTQITDAQAKLIFYSAFVEANSMLPRAYGPRSIVCTSSRNTRSSRREPCGAYRMRSPAHSRSSIQFRSSRRQRSWASFSPNCRLNGLVPFTGHRERGPITR